MVKGAANVRQISVEAMNNSTSCEVKALKDKLHYLQERFEETESSERVPLRGHGRLDDRVNVLEDLLHSLQNQQRLNSDAVFNTSQVVQTMEIESQFRAVGREIQQLQGMVGQRAEEFPSSLMQCIQSMNSMITPVSSPR